MTPDTRVNQLQKRQEINVLGQMMNMELTVNSLIDHAARYHGDAEIV